MRLRKIHYLYTTSHHWSLGSLFAAMRSAIVVGLLLLAITSQHSGLKFVKHDCTRNQLSPFIAVSPALCRLASDRRLFAVADRVYRPQPQRSPSTVLVALLLLLSGIERNPGPSASPSSCLGLLNARSTCHKAALIHDVIADNRLDILLLTETWIPSDAPDAAKLDVAPSGYTAVHHRHRAASTERRGDGLAVIHRDSSGQHRSTSATTASSSHSL